MATTRDSLTGLARAGALGVAGLGLIAVELAPLHGQAAAALTPDLLFCLLAAATLARPGAAPAALVFGLGLARDLLGGGPVGAGALGLLAALLLLDEAAPSLRRRGFGVRWAAALGAAAAAVALPWLLLTLAFAEAPALADLVLRLIATALAFPVLALAVRLAPRIGPGDPVAAGQAMFARRLS